MKWVLRVFGLLLFVFVIAFAAGVLVPKEHVASVRAVYAAEKDAVWNTVANFEEWPKWNKDVRGVQRQPDVDGKPYWLVQHSWGDMPQVVEEVAPSQRMVTVLPREADLGYSGSWTWEVEENEQGTVLTITERGMVTNPIFRFLSRFVVGYHGSLNEVHKQLGGEFGRPLILEEL